MYVCVCVCEGGVGWGVSVCVNKNEDTFSTLTFVHGKKSTDISIKSCQQA